MPMSAEASRANSALNSPAECSGSRAPPGSNSGGNSGNGPHKGLPKNPLDGGPGMFAFHLPCCFILFLAFVCINIYELSSFKNQYISDIVFFEAVRFTH